MIQNEIQTISELVSETEEAVSISRQLHDFFVAQVKRARDSRPEGSEIDLAALLLGQNG